MHPVYRPHPIGCGLSSCHWRGLPRPQLRLPAPFVSTRPRRVADTRETRLFAARKGNDKDKTICNEDIRDPEVRLLDEDKTMLGIVPIDVALEKARQKGLDLVMVSATANPPLCQICEYSKYRYLKEKAGKEARKKQRASRFALKELKMRPTTEVHDYNVRLKKAVTEIGKGNHVKVVVSFKGREFQFKDQGAKLIQRFIADLGDIVTIEKGVRFEGRQMTATLSPKK